MRTDIRLGAVALASALVLSACGGGDPAPSSFPGLSVDGKAGYLASGTTVLKFDVETGVEQWRYPRESQTRVFFAGPPLKFGDVVVVGGATGPGGTGTYDNHLYALNEQTGAEVWRFQATGPGGAPGREFASGAVTDGKLLFAANGNNLLYALDPAKIENGQPRVAWTFTANNKLWSRPQVSNGMVYQGSLDHNLYAIDAATGREVWRFESAAAPIVGQPALSNGTLYFGSFDANFYAVDAASGQLKWKSPVDAWVFTDPLVANGAVYFGDTKGKVYALDAATGARKWFFEARNEVNATPVLAGNALFVVSADTFVYALDANGEGKDAAGRVDFKNSRRNETLGRRLLTSPALVGTTLLVAPLDGGIKVAALNTESPTLANKWVLPPAQPGK